MCPHSEASIIRLGEKKMSTSLRERFIESKSNLLFAVSVFWFAVRVIPKPSRIMYPCQRTTLSIIFAELGIGIGATCFTLTKFAKQKLVKLLMISVLLIHLCLPFALAGYYSARYWILSQGRIQYGITNNMVIRVHSSAATNWDFSTGYYWEAVDQTVVNQMVEEGVKAFTGVADAQTAWQTILTGYMPGDIVGIKVNGNDMPGFTNNQNYINTLPQLINAVINGVTSIGVPETDVWVIEPTGSSNGYRSFYAYYYTLINGLYPGVHLLDRDDISFGSNPELRVSFPYTGDLYITDQMAEIDHLINIPIMKAITTYWGITGAIKSMQGNIQNQIGLHDHLGRTTADNPNVLIYQNQHIINKTRLIVGDGLFGMWTGMHFPESSHDIPQPWQTFSNDAPNSLFFARDPVAIDCVMVDYINAERTERGLSSLPDPQLQAGAAAGLGTRDHAPYSDIEYVDIEL